MLFKKNSLPAFLDSFIHKLLLKCLIGAWQHAKPWRHMLARVSSVPGSPAETISGKTDVRTQVGTALHLCFHTRLRVHTHTVTQDSLTFQGIEISQPRTFTVPTSEGNVNTVEFVPPEMPSQSQTKRTENSLLLQ